MQSTLKSENATCIINNVQAIHYLQFIALPEENNF
jgi:hypothetical protein